MQIACIIETSQHYVCQITLVHISVQNFTEVHQCPFSSCENKTYEQAHNRRDYHQCADFIYLVRKTTIVIFPVRNGLHLHPHQLPFLSEGKWFVILPYTSFSALPLSVTLHRGSSSFLKKGVCGG